MSTLVPVRLVTLLPFVLATAACAATSPPRRFAGTLTGGVSLDDLGPWPARDRGQHPDPARRVATLSDARTPGAERLTIGDDGVVVWRDDLVAEGPVDGSAVISPLPAPHLQPSVKAGTAAIDVAAAQDVAALRALVGQRDGRDGLAFAIAAASALRGVPDQAGADLGQLADGPALVALAVRRGAADERTAAPAPGDLLVFDRALADAAASLIAVALTTDERGVTEMLYLARGVVRRGFVDVAHAAARRDADGRTRNTYVRHGKDYPPRGTHYLAGELLAHVVVWARLTRP